MEIHRPQLAAVGELGSLFSARSRVKLPRKPAMTRHDRMRRAYRLSELTRKASRDPRWCSLTNQPRQRKSNRKEPVQRGDNSSEQFWGSQRKHEAKQMVPGKAAPEASTSGKPAKSRLHLPLSVSHRFYQSPAFIDLCVTQTGEKLGLTSDMSCFWCWFSHPRARTPLAPEELRRWVPPPV